MSRFLSKGLLLCAGLLAMPALTHPGQDATDELTYEQDGRYARLKEYLEERGYPIAHLAADYLAAADRNGLDWRLLPAMSIQESGGGRFYVNNNILGWGSGKVRFPSVRAGIHRVADRLSLSKLYRDKDLDQVLRTYNPHPAYARRIKGIMNALHPSEPATAATP